MAELPRATLTRDAVVTEALALIDEDGLEKLSMRRLATRLGVEAMSLYNHVADKSDLLRGVADAVLAEMQPPMATSEWDERIRWVLGEFRRVCLDHPDAVPLVVTTGFTTAAAMGSIDDILGALATAGLDDTARVRSFRTLIAYAVGSISCELADQANAGSATADGQAGTLPATSAGLPHLTEIAELLSTCDYDTDFAAGLDLLLRSMTD